MLILFVALILAMIVFGIGLKIFENHMPEPVISEDGFLMDEQSEELAALGSLKLNGNIYSYYHDFETYLIMGTDKTGADSKVYQGSMSDFLMLVIVDKTDNNYSFLPINRDTMSEVRLIQDDGTGVATAVQHIGMGEMPSKVVLTQWRVYPNFSADLKLMVIMQFQWMQFQN
mgnify:CR=1 FL=1